MRKKILPIILVLFAANAHAQWTTNTAVNTSFCTGNTFNDPHIVDDGSGNYYVSTRPLFGHGFYGVGMQRISHDGVLQWGDQGIWVSQADKNSSYTTVYSLAADNSGNAIVAYSDFRNGNANIYVNKIDPDGNRLWGQAGIRLSISTNQDFDPQILSMGNGDVIVAWLNSDVSALYLQRISPDGRKMWGADGIRYYDASAALPFLNWPHLASAGDLNFYLVFERANASFFASKQNIRVQKFDLSGSSLWSSEKIILAQSTLGTFPIFYTEKDRQGGLLVTWLDDRNSGFGFNAFVQHMDDSGNMLLAADGVDTYGIPGNLLAINDAKSTIDDDGNIFTAFYNNNQLYIQKIDASGNLLWKTTAHLILNYPSVSSSINWIDWRADGADGAHHWLAYELDDSYSQDNFYGYVINKFGYKESEPQIVISTLPGTKAYPCSAAGDGQAVYCWQNQNDGSVSGQNVTHSEPEVAESMVALQASPEIYPNPSAGILNISGIQTNQSTVTLRVMNAVGQVIWNEVLPASSEIQIDLSKFSGGSYFLQMNDGLRVTQKSFVLAR